MIHLLIDSIKMMMIAILRNLRYSKRGKNYSPKKLKNQRVKMFVMGRDHRLLYLLLHLIRTERIHVKIVRRKSIDSKMAKKPQFHLVQ